MQQNIANLRERLKAHQKKHDAEPSAPKLASAPVAAAAPALDTTTGSASQARGVGVHTARALITQLDGTSPTEWEGTLATYLGNCTETWLSFLKYADSMMTNRSHVLTISSIATNRLDRASLRKTEPYIQLWLHRVELQFELCSDPQDAKETLDIMRHEGIGQTHVDYFITRAKNEKMRGNPGKAEKFLRDGFKKCPDFHERLHTAWESVLGRACNLDAPAAEEEQTAMFLQGKPVTGMPVASVGADDDDDEATVQAGAVASESLLKTPAAGDDAPTVMLTQRRGSSTKKSRQQIRRFGALAAKPADRVDGHTAELKLEELDAQAAASGVATVRTETAAEEYAATAANADAEPTQTYGSLEPIVEANSSVEASSAEGTPTVDDFHTAVETELAEDPMSPASTFKPGDRVVVHSKSKKQWLQGKVESLVTDQDVQNGELIGDVRVIYGEGIKKCVDPKDRDSIRHKQKTLADRIQDLELNVKETKEFFVFEGGGSYKKLGVYGKGGSCKVFKVLDGDGNIQALKRVRGLFQNGDDREYEPFVNEIELLRKLNNPAAGVSNPNIIVLYDAAVCRKNKAVYMVFEPGEIDLHQLLQKNEGQQSFKDNYIRLYWQQMLEAVKTIHNERIVHSDLKPANFLMVAGTLKLIDFGIAKGIEGYDTTNIVRENQVGTMNYMSPETFEPPEVDNEFKLSRKSDIWSLGCILYQMVYGKTPFHHIRNQMKKMHAITNPNHEIKFPPHPDKMLLETMKLCFNRDHTKRPSIPALLEHPYVTGGMATVAAAAIPAEPASNVHLQEILRKVASGDVAAEDLLKKLDAGASTEDLSEVLRRQPSTHGVARASANDGSQAVAAAESVRNVPPAPALRQTQASGSCRGLPLSDRGDLNQEIAMGKGKLKKASDRQPLQTVENAKPLNPADDFIRRMQKRRQLTAEETNELTATTSDDWSG